MTTPNEQDSYSKDLIKEKPAPIPNASNISVLLRQQLEVARKQLLDLTLRNPLVNYSWDKSVRGVKFEQGKENNLLSNLFSQLLDDDIVEFIPSDIHVRSKHRLVFTSFTADNLHKRLTKLYREANTFQQEQGFNILYIAFGFLEWYEADQSTNALFAPLLLVPVTLQRKQDGGYTCICSQEEVENNPSLKQKLQEEFGFSLPDWKQPSEDAQIIQSLIDYRIQIEDQLRQHPACARWKVHPQRAVLDKFSFAKLAMYNDLDPANLSGNGLPTIETLLSGNGTLSSSTGSEDQVDVNELSVEELDNVVEADSSQMKAIRMALKGHHLIVQGPPGTGKSQTIANLIASAVRQGKKVLFVAEKMAALEVVKRRLDQIGLGQACLELHSHKARPKEVVIELEKTLLANPVTISDYNADLNKLVTVRHRLQAYYQQLTDPINKTGYSPYRAIGEQNQLLNRYLGLAPQLIAGIKNIHTWSAEQITARVTVVQEACRRVSQYGPARQSPFYGSELLYVRQQDLMEIAALLRTLVNTLETLQVVRGKFAEFGTEAPTIQTISDLLRVKKALDVLIAKPSLLGIDNLTNPEWANAQDLLKQAFASTHQLHKHQLYVKEQVVPNALTVNLYSIRQAYQEHSRKWYKRFVTDFTNSRKALQLLHKNPLPKDVAAQTTIIDILIAFQENTQQLEKQLPRIRQFVSQVRTDEFGWSNTEAACEYMVTLHQLIRDGHIDKWVVYHLNNDEDTYRQLTSMLNEALSQWQERLLMFNQISGFSQDNTTLSNDNKIPLDDLIKQLEGMADGVSMLPNLADWNASKKILDVQGLGVLIEYLEAKLVVPDQIYDSFLYTLYTDLADYARQNRAQLQQLNGTELRHTTNQYSQLEGTLLAINRARVMEALLKGRPSQTNNKSIGELGILRKEFNKKRRMLPLRRLFTEAGQAIQAIKPVIMMSPLSIARNLPQQALQFDIVIFDEASQVKPVDAFGALLRAKQAIVVGDKQQMPPSNFFEKSATDDEVADEEDIDDQFAQETESILQLFAGRNALSTMLMWHYRSRHDSLIRVSNRFFYDDNLIVVPSPVRQMTNMGLQLRRVNSVYLPKAGNELEAEAVVQAISEHARTRPNKTLGVVALNMAQMDCIENKIDKVRLTDPALDAFINAYPDEPFFVKNLESVQGDERDVIFVSIGFGKQKDGSLHMRFGPVNAEGGHRRLNVLFTRAKEQCVIFTGLTSNDIRLNADDTGKRQGLRILKEFLQFAETGELSVSHSVGSGTESPFEEAVKQTLEHAGYTVDTQIGASGFRIDLGIRDPNYIDQIRYLAGIECDGATYHRSRIARDRDHIRQQVLEGMGWHIYRVWSTDWFVNSAIETRKLLEHLNSLKVQHSAPTVTSIPSVINAPSYITIVEEPQEPVPDNTVRIPYPKLLVSYRSARNGLDKEDADKVVDLTRRLIEAEGPLHIDYLMKRIGNAYAVAKIGSKIEKNLSYAFTYATRCRGMFREGDFLWLETPSLNVPVRSRETLDDNLRKIEWVPPQEIQAAMLVILRQNYSAESKELMQATMKVLGFHNLTSTAQKVVEPNIQALIHTNLIQDDGARVKLLDA